MGSLKTFLFAKWSFARGSDSICCEIFLFVNSIYHIIRVKGVSITHATPSFHYKSTNRTPSSPRSWNPLGWAPQPPHAREPESRRPARPVHSLGKCNSPPSPAVWTVDTSEAADWGSVWLSPRMARLRNHSGGTDRHANAPFYCQVRWLFDNEA